MAEIEVVHAEGPLREAALDLFLQGRKASEQARLGPHRREGWRRVIDENPHAGPALPARVWLARIDRRPAGVLLGVPFRGRAGGLELRGHWGVDLYVPEAFRGRGIGAAVLTRWRDESPLALGLGITDEAYRIELSLGWKPVTLPPRCVCPLTTRGALLLKLPPGRAVAGAGAAGRPGDLEVRVSGRPEAAAAALWARIAADLPAHVERDRASILWRYGEPRLLVWVGIERDGRLEALAALRIDRSGLRNKAWILEMLVAPGDERLGRRLVVEMLAAARIQGADLVEGRLSAPHLWPWLEAEGFLASRRTERFIVHAGPALTGERLHERPWYLTLGDSGNP